MRLELLISGLGAVTGAVGYALDHDLLEYVAVLLAVSGLSLLVARALAR